MRLAQHILLWLTIATFLILTFSQADKDYLKSFYFVTFLLPVAIGTSYLFNYWLVPQYLLRRRYFKFALYFLYLLILSLYFEMIVLTIAFIVLANYKYANLNTYTTNPLLMTSTVYLVVFFHAFVLLIKRYQRKEHLLNEMMTNTERNAQHLISVRVDRQNKLVRLDELQVVESLADYVKLHTTSGLIITREKISELQNKLPDHFVRVHRSFIVNKQHVKAFGKEELTVGDLQIKISRTYKKAASEALAV